MLALTFATPALAFEGRGGDTVVVAAGEVIDDDLYVGATTFTLEGIVNGDLFAVGQTITINGTVTGNLLTAGNSVVINGRVEGDVLAAAGVLFWGPESDVGGDVLGAGGSLEMREGSEIGRDALLAAGQILLAGDVARDLQAGAYALEIAGSIGGDVNAQVGEASEPQQPMGMWMGQSPVRVPDVAPGITIASEARIGGDLEYTQDREISIPAGVVAGRVSRLLQPVEASTLQREPTTAERTGKWALDSVRALVTLILLGLLLLWLLPRFMPALSGDLRARPWKSLGWGAVGYFGFFVLLFVTLTLMIMGAILFGVLTLAGLSASIVWTGLLALFGLILGFALVTTFLAKIVCGMALGEWILKSAKSPLAEHKVWPMVIGVLITAAALALFAFPSLPGVLAWLLNAAIVLFGLGAVVLRTWWAVRPAPKVA
jgi:cytoskeletal protein CcmA (bactofilin family)